MNKINELKRRLYRRSKKPIDTEVSVGTAVFEYGMKRLRKKTARKGGSGETLESLFRRLDVQPTPFFTDESLKGRVKNVALHPVRLDSGGVMILPNHKAEEYERFIKTALNKGGKAVIVSRTLFEESGIAPDAYPVALAEDPLDAAVKYFRPIREAYDGLVIGITGSYGKTTTKNYIASVLEQQMDAFVSPANFNSSYDVADYIARNMRKETKAFVMESGAAKIGSIGVASRLLAPDIAIVTNIEEHHLDAYKTLVNLTHDKMQLVEQLHEGGTAIVNFDNEILAGYDYSCNVISYGMKHEGPLTYRAVNVRQEGSMLTMDIEHDGQLTRVESGVHGEINAYNILAAFAVGQYCGMPEETICRGISTYSTSGTRQNMTEYGQNTLYVDCYNAGLETTVASMKTFEDLELPEGGRKIAVLGGENKLGEFRTQRTVALGEAVSDAKVDEIICYGSADESDASLNKYGDAKTLYETIKKNGFENVRLIQDFDELVEYLRKNVKENDAVMFKCIVYLNMAAAIDKVFGTAFCLTQKSVRKRAKMKTIKGFTGFVVPDMNEAYITNVSKKLLGSRKITIPDTFDGVPVYGIGKGVFAYSDAAEVDFGKTIRHIGTGAFKGCRNIKAVELPDSVMHIMPGAFSGCCKLESVRTGSGIRQIDEGAFAGCRSLKTVDIGSEEVRIEEGAFPS